MRIQSIIRPAIQPVTVTVERLPCVLRTPIVVAALALAIPGCVQGRDDHDDARARAGQALVQQYDATQDAFGDCVDALTQCVQNAADLDAIEACAGEVEACLAAAEPEIEIPDPEDLPDLPEIPGIDTACFDDVTDCIDADPTDPTCLDGIDGCVQDQLDGLCETAQMQCEALGAPQDICDALGC
ncbi:MAG: hypothetical protein IPH07_14505 [Deltaproteobacteria bacterium]|nr:hypothetical protein [Deltaproteobacteria bacterium]MBK8238987.1 hypothetical protein [Deltaproteobacteria bacterium]MBK8717499.1 hypothetical protein [Deltaproteobacteria bacterium]MBP7289581.1 hypothetical protein [Nannocystaceae bacterium]